MRQWSSPTVAPACLLVGLLVWLVVCVLWGGGVACRTNQGKDISPVFIHGLPLDLMARLLLRSRGLGDSFHLIQGRGGVLWLPFVARSEFRAHPPVSQGPPSGMQEPPGITWIEQTKIG